MGGFRIDAARKCPRCGSRDYERVLVYERVTRHENGRTTVRFRSAGDAGLFRCLKCGFEDRF